jgi:hypothetical protein
MVILKTILNSFRNLEISFQKNHWVCNKKKLIFFANVWNFVRKKTDYSCPTIGIFKVKETLVPIFLRKKFKIKISMVLVVLETWRSYGVHERTNKETWISRWFFPFFQNFKEVTKEKHIRVNQKWHFKVPFKSLFPLYLRSNKFVWFSTMFKWW